jgi:plastocyanin
LLVAALVIGVACADDDAGDVRPAGTSPSGSAGNSPVAEGARRIEVVGRSFEFDPAEISAQTGEDLAIVLESEDVSHDFVIDEFEGRVEAVGGSSAVGGFRAGSPGRYRFYCSIGDHRAEGMVGVLVVED